jgi:nucleotide-binding universal stress UspA family protein
MKVLAALDFGDSSLEALRHARTLAHDLGGSVAACHVLPTAYHLTALLPERSLNAQVDAANEDASTRKALVEHVRSKVGLELTEVFIERGAAYAEIVRCADRWRADVIAIGSHGRTGLARAFLGNVAERVARHAHCSVLVARPFEGNGVVLAATDLSDPSLPAIAAGAAAAKRTGARLVVVTVLEWAGFAGSSFVGLMGTLPAVPPLEVQKQLRDATLSTLEQAMAQVGAVGEARVLEGSAASAIVSCAEELRPELLVIGSHGRTGLARLALGSIAESVIRNASCSVLTVRLAS